MTVEWTDLELSVFHDIRQELAITSRYVTAKRGPRPNWSRLLDRQIIREVKTTYGPVLTLTEAQSDAEGITQRLRGPASLADRAYMMDAVRLLKRHGYEWLSWDYKRYRDTRQLTAHITRARMSAPEEERLPILARYRNPASRIQPNGMPEEMLGEPWMYARCSGGGIKATQLRALLKTHRNHITLYWRSPLLIVVPEEDASLRALIRRENETHRRSYENARKHTGVPDGLYRPLVTAFVLPLPSLVRRVSQPHPAE